ncbi:PilN domain-containing protein [Planobispora siamensis]|uniref:Tfp pilus assembly protein PilN n=1 Tax=Planobispora siamensis TaxID=936338 RepID=A0A8J3SHV1_9ACTN|nr:PilN domain-containing protein [Planobispora siamensis]GIH89968.1 hypothetical protein Psi01_05980 [Planobispora siamensis]
MTATTVQPGPAVPAQDPFRTLPIAADLLPPEIVAARRGRRVRAVVLSALGVFVLALAGWYVFAGYQTAAKEEELVTAEAEVQRLTRDQNEFSELVTTQSEVETINGQLSALLATDLQWADLLSATRKAAPDGVSVTGVTGQIKDPAAGDAVDENALPNTSGKELVGELTITGTGEDKKTVAAYVDALGKVTGLGNPLLTDAHEMISDTDSTGDTDVDFTVRADITGSALGGRFSADVKKGS